MKMHVFYSCEIDQNALLSFTATEAVVKAALEVAIEKSTLTRLDVKIQYVPIVMTAERRNHYPARSRIQHKKRIFSCCPQLSITPFLTGTEAERVREFVAGLREVGPALSRLNVPRKQVLEFDEILTTILNELVD
jgi:hypothetical protein